ncbi:TonB-dependent receptor plug domain-containing protein [Porticoccaceae bacterium LTM1]|nr:TonB-dependent receptor plug domain-containing protein [Porticoccaceae bacterium LTM1]
MIGNKSISRKKLSRAIASGVLMVCATAAVADEKTVVLELKSQSAGQMLTELGELAGVQIMVDHKVPETLVLSSISGEYKLEEALKRILKGTGLVYEFASDQLVLIKEEDVAEGGKREKQEVEEIVVTGSSLISDPGKMTRQVTTFTREDIERSGTTRLDEFLQRLPQNVNAPTNVASGYPNGVSHVDFGMGANVFAGSSVNLRGLGSQYTLILIDGRRPPKGGQFGGVTDISNIPIEQVERIEILFDGAASIYGADAVGGVVNIITRREFAGTNVSLTYSDTTEGGGARINFGLGKTFNWGSGSLSAMINYQTQEQIEGDQRGGLEFSESVYFDLPTSNPGNISGIQSNTGHTSAVMWVKDVNGDGDTLDEELNERIPGGVWTTIEKRSASTGFQWVASEGYVDRENAAGDFFTRIPNPPANPADDGYTAVRGVQLPQYSSDSLSLYDIDVEGGMGANEYVPFDGMALSPEDETITASINLSQDISETLSFGLSVMYGTTDKASNTKGDDGIFNIDVNSEANPFNQPLRYAFVNVFPQETQSVHSTNASVAGSVNWDFHDDWRLELGFGAGETKSSSENRNRLRTEGTTFTKGQDWTWIPNLEDLFNGYFTEWDASAGEMIYHDLGTDFRDPYLGYGSPEALADDVVIPLLLTTNNSSSRDVDLRLSGTLFELPAGAVRASMSAAHRQQKNRVFNSNDRIWSSALSGQETSPDVYYDEEYGDKTNSVATEISVPLIGEENALPLVEDLLFSASARMEDYTNTDENGLNWSAGFNWSLNDWMTVRLNRTYSLRIAESVRSARAPKYNRQSRWLIRDPNLGYVMFDTTRGDPALWTISGGSDHLKPERNYGTALGFIFKPTFLDGLNIQLNLTESNTHDQFGSPNMGSLTLDAMSPENVANNPLLTYADPENNPEQASIIFENFFGAFPMATGDLIKDSRTYNVGHTYNRGADLQVRYNFASEFGQFMLGWSHQYLDKNEIIQSDVCANGACMFQGEGTNNDRHYDMPIDIVGTIDRRYISGRFALPKNRGSFDFSWYYRGLGVNLNTQYQETTSVINNPTQIMAIEDGQIVTKVNQYRVDTTPGRSVNMSLSYEFSSGDLLPRIEWFENATVSLTISDLWRKEREEERVWLQHDYEEGDLYDAINRYTVNPRGRAFSLNLRGSF